jgi:hypothetical protein
MERFALQSVVRDILPNSITAHCLRYRRGSRTGEIGAVSVWRVAESRTAHYKGLQTCASVWACPVCSSKISEKRRAELQLAITSHKAAGGEVYLLTLTNRHARRDNLGELLSGQAKALGYFMRGSKSSKKWFDSLGSIGTVRAWEVTHQDANGWHPHFHILVFGKAGLELGQLQHDGFTLWANCCRLAKLEQPSEAHGLSLQDGEYAAKYVGKWGLDYEMTKGHQKKAKTGGATPFDLLRRVLADSRDAKSRALFAEFALTFKGRRQLVWSKGLKARFAVDETSDEELAEGATAGSEFFAQIGVIAWRAVVACDMGAGGSIRGQLLEHAGAGDRLRFDLLLEGVKARYLARFRPGAISSRGSFVKVQPHRTFMNTPLRR